MDDFAVLYARFQRVNDPELVQYLDLIDEMAPGHADCQACSAKILAFCERYTENRLPERYHLYVEQFQRVTAHRRDPRRDFRQEVRAHIGG